MLIEKLYILSKHHLSEKIQIYDLPIYFIGWSGTDLMTKYFKPCLDILYFPNYIGSLFKSFFYIHILVLGFGGIHLVSWYSNESSPRSYNRMWFILRDFGHGNSHHILSCHLHKFRPDNKVLYIFRDLSNLITW